MVWNLVLREMGLRLIWSATSSSCVTGITEDMACCGLGGEGIHAGEE